MTEKIIFIVMIMIMVAIIGIIVGFFMAYDSANYQYQITTCNLIYSSNGGINTPAYCHEFINN